eukprot:Platyproteum_vivax@DN7610_c2_g1_i2.p1
MVSTNIFLLFLLSAVLVHVYGTDPPAITKISAVLIGPQTVYEEGGFTLDFNFTVSAELLDRHVPRNKSFVARVNCWGFDISSKALGYYNSGANIKWLKYRMWTTVVGNHGPTRCECSLEHRNEVFARVEGELGEQTGFPGPTILPKPATTVFQKYLDFTSYNMTVGARQLIKIGMEHQDRWLTD